MTYTQIITKEKQTIITEKENGIVEIQFADDFMCETKHIMKIHDSLKKIAKTRRKKLLIINVNGKYTSVTSETQIYVSKGFHKKFVEAEAFVVQTFSQRLMTRFLINVLDPKVQSRYFNDANDAEKWLKEKQSSQK